MAVRYDRLFAKLNERNMSNGELTRRAGFSGNIMTRIKRNEYVSLESIEKICRVLECSTEDIIEFIEDKDV